MATGIIGTMAVSTTLRYTPTSDAKVQISITGSGGTFSINGTVVASTNLTSSLYVFVGANQTITFLTNASCTAVISSLEST